MYIFGILYEYEYFRIMNLKEKFEFESTGSIQAHLSNGVGKLFFLGQCFAINYE